MSKTPLDFDFSEISNTLKVEAPPPPAPPAPPKVEGTKPLGIAIALEPEPNRVVLKDLAELTGEEFLQWATRVFPVLNQKESNPRDYDSRSAKAAAFDHILKFHTHSIFHVKKELNWDKPH